MARSVDVWPVAGKLVPSCGSGRAWLLSAGTLACLPRARHSGRTRVARPCGGATDKGAEKTMFLTARNRALISLSGEDRQAFLQGLVSNDVTKVTPTRALYAAFLTAQGKYLHDIFIAADGQRLL